MFKSNRLWLLNNLYIFLKFLLQVKSSLIDESGLKVEGGYFFATGIEQCLFSYSFYFQ
eukprot:UN09857